MYLEKGCYETSDIPIISYTSIKLNGEDIALSGSKSASFVSPFNKVTIKFKSTQGQSLRRFEVRVTKANADYGVGIGTCPVLMTNIQQNVEITADIEISATYFNQGDGTYRVGLYAQSTSSVWDFVYIFITSENYNFLPSGSTGLEVLSDENTTIPSTQYGPMVLDDGSCWIPILVHNVNNGAYLFSSSDTAAAPVYRRFDLFHNFALLNSADRPEAAYWELLTKSQEQVGGAFSTYRFKQKINPMTASWSDVNPSQVGTNVERVAGGGSYGGMYKIESANGIMCFANSSNGNWYGCGIKVLWGGTAGSNGYIPVYNGLQCRGYQLVYLRVTNAYYVAHA